ncbi:hypothetical protein [Streptosporangium subroseum]|nr:hypothetical protein [Streptosporangium subroseum]
MFAKPALLLDGPQSAMDFRNVVVLDWAAENLVPVLLGLPLGVLIDRVRRRRSVLVVMALLGMVAVASVTVADGLGAAGGPHALAVMTVMAALAAVTPVGQDAYLPSIVGRGRLVPANALLSVLPQALLLGLAAILSLLDGSEFAFLVVVSVAMAGATLLFRGVDATEAPPPPRAGLWREMAEGIRFTAKQPVLRAITLYLVVSALFAELVDEATDEARNAVMDAAERDASLSEFYWWSVTVPLYSAPLLGALLSVLLHRRLGAFRLAWWAVLVSQPFILLLALSGTDWGQLWYTIGEFVPLTGTIVVAIALLSHRQAITPERLLGRVGGLLLGLTGLADILGNLLGAPVHWLAEFGGSTPTPLVLLPGLALATFATLAAAVPLLRARHLAADPVLETTTG